MVLGIILPPSEAGKSAIHSPLSAHGAFVSSYEDGSPLMQIELDCESTSYQSTAIEEGFVVYHCLDTRIVRRSFHADVSRFTTGPFRE